MSKSSPSLCRSGFTSDTCASAELSEVGREAGPTTAEPAAAPSPASRTAPALRGHLHLAAATRPTGETYLARQSFRAPFHLSKPYWDGRVLHAQLVNSTAGILAGDELELDITIESGASLAVTTPAAARAFMMQAGAARCRQRFAVGAGAWLEYLPEPLFPHRETDYAQHTSLELAAGASAFFTDQLAPGRVGRGECWSWRRLRMALQVGVDGRLLLREQLDASGAELARLANFHGMPEAWFGTAVIAAPALAADAPVWEQLRALHRNGCLCGVTTLAPSVWIVRLVAANGLVLRDTFMALRTALAAVLPGLQADLRKL
ncbi:MAG TPA: urease accessory protein UreD [Opitutaceae bacterium]|nr:urease accessory protein UreD [Opitutaceae bacterium]